MTSQTLLSLNQATHINHASILLSDLFQAYSDCRGNKRNTLNALRFEIDYEQQLILLYDEINSGRYLPGRSIAFVANKPVKREIFAADFRDRVVHHWIINKLNPLFERVFIYDSYACRTGRGSSLAIARADRFIRRCSQNYTRDCYILKLDIQNFFMSIDKRILWAMLQNIITQYYDDTDKSLILSLCYKVLSHNPTKNCFIKGRRDDWVGLPPQKSLFHAPYGCGLPIGNLTSQVFANVYMNRFDHFVKHELGVMNYGRYVDDFILVHQDKGHLQSLIAKISCFLKEELCLTLHPNKIYLQHYSKGVHYLGSFIKPNRVTCGKRIKSNFYDAIYRSNELVRENKPSKEDQLAFLCSMNSYLGIMKQYRTYRLRKKMLKKHLSIWWWNLVYLSNGSSKLVFIQKTVKNLSRL